MRPIWIGELTRCRFDRSIVKTSLDAAKAVEGRGEAALAPSAQNFSFAPSCEFYRRHFILDVTLHFTAKSVHARCERRLIRTKTILSRRTAEQPSNRVPQLPKQSQRARSLSSLLDRESRVDCDSTSPETRVVGQPSSRAFIAAK